MVKNKKKGLSEVITNRRKQSKSMNPFEVRVNREKFQVIGRVTKFARGLPGVARSRAIKKRKETLLQEYKVKEKSNRFLDKRIGERSKAMTNEDKIIARFTAEKMRAHKKMIFNLADDEVLTHKGRSITEVERYDDPRSDDDDDNEVGALDADFVDGANFGGGTLTKSTVSRESVIDQLIADSKKRKIEKQMAKEKTLEMTEKLDADWKDLVPLMRTKKPKEDDDEDDNGGKKKRDPYDLAMKELIFEARGKPSDRLKSEEEVAEAEMKKLQELEEERLRRMRGEDTQVSVVSRKHKSADDLDDGFQISKRQVFSVMYDKDGNLINPPEEAEANSDDEEQVKKSFKLNQGSNEDEGSDEEDDEEGSEESDEESSDDDDDFSDLKPRVDDDDSDDSDNGEEEESGIDKSSQRESSVEKGEKSLATCLKERGISEDKGKGLESKSASVKKRNISEDKDEGKDAKSTPKKRPISEDSNEGSEAKKSSLKKWHVSEEEDPDKEETESPPKKIKSSDPSESLSKGDDKSTRKRKNSECAEEKSDAKGEVKKVSFKSDVDEVRFGENAPSLNKKSAEEFRLELSKRKELMDKAREELPFTFTAPETYEDLEKVLDGRKPDEVAVIIERMIKCNHPKLKEENKEKMPTLFAFLMQYVNDLDYKNCWIYLDRLVPFLYDLAQFSPPEVAKCLVEILKEKHSDYDEKQHKYPPVSALVFLKLIPLLFPASDRRHPVTTPALVFMTQVLQNAKATSRVAISSGLFMCSLIYEYVSFSKRISPQAINFLLGLLHISSKPDLDCDIVPPFLKNQRYLYLHQPCTIEKCDFKMSNTDLSSKSGKIDDTFRVRSVYAGLNLLNMFMELYKEHHGVGLLFQPFDKYLSKFPVENYQPEVKEMLDLVVKQLKSILEVPLKPLAKDKMKPKALRLYEPSIEPVYENRRRNAKENPEKAEKERLLHKYKREMKGAIREIRKDTKFISKVKFKERAAGDAERKKKVQQIYSWAAEQQADLRKLEKQKRKHKF